MRTIAGAASVIAIIAAIVVARSKPVAADKRADAVIVVNDPANALPVVGSVNGTVSVVGPIDAQQAGRSASQGTLRTTRSGCATPTTRLRHPFQHTFACVINQPEHQPDASRLPGSRFAATISGYV
jgi:hypothetical protein